MDACVLFSLNFIPFHVPKKLLYSIIMKCFQILFVFILRIFKLVLNNEWHQCYQCYLILIFSWRPKFTETKRKISIKHIKILLLSKSHIINEKKVTQKVKWVSMIVGYCWVIKMVAKTVYLHSKTIRTICHIIDCLK